MKICRESVQRYCSRREMTYLQVHDCQNHVDLNIFVSGSMDSETTAHLYDSRENEL